MHAQEVSEVPMTSPNHALQYCHVIMYVYLIPYSRVVTPPPIFSAKLLLRVTFCSLIRPPHLHMHTCVWLALTSMFTLVLRCYYVVTTLLSLLNIFACSLAEGCMRTCGTGL